MKRKQLDNIAKRNLNGENCNWTWRSVHENSKFQTNEARFVYVKYSASINSWVELCLLRTFAVCYSFKRRIVGLYRHLNYWNYNSSVLEIIDFLSSILQPSGITHSTNGIKRIFYFISFFSLFYNFCCHIKLKPFHLSTCIWISNRWKKIHKQREKCS